MNNRITIGKIIGAHGIKGEIKVFPLTDNVRRFNKLKKCYVGKEDADGKLYEVSKARVDRGNALLTFAGIDDRDEAEKLKGLFISVDREDAVKIPKDRYFIVDLIGLDVIDDERGSLGKISDVWNTGANDVISVKRSGKKELLIPFLKSCCYETNIEEGYMKVRLPDGLYEIYE